MSSKKSTNSGKQAAARALRSKSSNGSAKTAARDRGLVDAGAGGRYVRRDAKTGEMTTKAITLRAFRRTYDRLHPRKDK